MIILGEVGGTFTFISSIIVFLLIPFTYERHNLKVFKEFQKRSPTKKGKKSSKGLKEEGSISNTTDYSSLKLLIHDIWSSFKKFLHKIWCCKNWVNVESEIWPGLSEVKIGMHNILESDFDLLCILKIGEMEKKLEELCNQRDV